MVDKRNHGDEMNVIASVQRGEEDVFATVYRMHFSSLCEFAYYLTRDEEIAKALVQDTFLTIWEQRSSWFPQGTIRSYLFKAVKNRSLDYLKLQKVVHNRENAVGTGSTDFQQPQANTFSPEQLVKAINMEVDKLPPDCRLIFILSRQHELTYNEIAQIQGVSKKTVEIQIGQALKKLRESLRDFL
jgi:RNA polymerase sigma-70 factor, ECF subfamily